MFWIKPPRQFGEKVFYHLPNSSFLSEWMPRTKKNNEDAVPLINAIAPISTDGECAQHEMVERCHRAFLLQR